MTPPPPSSTLFPYTTLFRSTHLRRVHRQGHRQTAADQNSRVRAAQRHIEMAAGLGEACRMHGASYRVHHEQTTEKHDFGHQEHPHAQRGGFPLLLEVSELLGEC